MIERHHRKILAVIALAALCGCSRVAEQPDAGAVSDSGFDVAIVACGPHASESDGGCVCDPGYDGDGMTCELTPAVAPTKGDLLIEELYYSGAPPNGGTDHYFSDQFIELVNTTDGPLDLSGVALANVVGSAGEINPGMAPDSYAESMPDQVVLESIWAFPDGTRLEAGATLIVAHDGTNHRPFSSIDLSGADFETYVADSGRDEDYPTVANLESVEFNGGFDWLVTVFGPSIVVIEAGAELGAGPDGYLTVRTSEVLDGVDALMDGDSRAFKRLPASVDAGFGYVAGTYVGESLHRRNDGGVWQDTDDSSADFVVGAPDPGRAPNSAGVFGDPWIELGTGVIAFEALDDAGSVELVAGGQGGFHVDAAVRFGGFGPGGVLLVFDAVDESAERVSYVTEALLWEDSVLPDAEGWARVGDRVVFDVADPTTLVDSTIIVRVTAELDGQTWSDERRVRIVDEIQ